MTHLLIIRDSLVGEGEYHEGKLPSLREQQTGAHGLGQGEARPGAQQRDDGRLDADEAAHKGQDVGPLIEEELRGAGGRVMRRGRGWKGAKWRGGEREEERDLPWDPVEG